MTKVQSDQMCEWASKVSMQAQEYADIADPKIVGEITNSLRLIERLALEIHSGLATLQCGAFDAHA